MTLDLPCRLPLAPSLASAPRSQRRSITDLPSSFSLGLTKTGTANPATLFSTRRIRTRDNQAGRCQGRDGTESLLCTPLVLSASLERRRSDGLHAGGESARMPLRTRRMRACSGCRRYLLRRDDWNATFEKADCPFGTLAIIAVRQRKQLFSVPRECRSLGRFCCREAQPSSRASRLRQPSAAPLPSRSPTVLSILSECHVYTG